MKMRGNISARRQAGFTMFELVVTLVVASFLSILLLPYMSTALSRSADSILRLQAQYELSSTMANIQADYIKNFKSNLVDLKAKVDSPTTRYVYGTNYYVATSYWFNFDSSGSGTWSAVPSIYLAVEITNNTGHVLNSIFVQADSI